MLRIIVTAIAFLSFVARAEDQPTTKVLSLDVLKARIKEAGSVGGCKIEFKDLGKGTTRVTLSDPKSNKDGFVDYNPSEKAPHHHLGTNTSQIWTYPHTLVFGDRRDKVGWIKFFYSQNSQSTWSGAFNQPDITIYEDNQTKKIIGAVYTEAASSTNLLNPRAYKQPLALKIIYCGDVGDSEKWDHSTYRFPSGVDVSTKAPKADATN